MTNPLERLAGGDLPPSPEETRRRILEQLAAEKLGKAVMKEEVKWGK